MSKSPVDEERGASKPVRILVLGTGQMGSGIARLVLERPDLELCGLVARRPGRCGRDAGRVLGLGHALGLAVRRDLACAIAETRPDVAIQATCSRLEDALEEITTLLDQGIHVISIAEELAWPRARSPQRAEELDALARAHRVCLLGTGVNPGFVLDLLLLALTGVCTRVDAIHAERVNDLSPYGPTVLRAQGVGLTPDAFLAGLEDGAVVGHIGFPESIGMIAASLGWQLDRVEQTREPIISRVPRETPFVSVKPGCAAGCRHTARGYRGGEPVITLVHPQQVQPELEGIATGDTLEVHGSPDVRLSGSPEIPGGAATIALAVNAIPRVLAASPGLRSMADLPVPVACGHTRA